MFGPDRVGDTARVSLGRVFGRENRINGSHGGRRWGGEVGVRGAVVSCTIDPRLHCGSRNAATAGVDIELIELHWNHYTYY